MRRRGCRGHAFLIPGSLSRYRCAGLVFTLNSHSSIITPKRSLEPFLPLVRCLSSEVGWLPPKEFFFFIPLLCEPSCVLSFWFSSSWLLEGCWHTTGIFRQYGKGYGPRKRAYSAASFTLFFFWKSLLLLAWSMVWCVTTGSDEKGRQAFVSTLQYIRSCTESSISWTQLAACFVLFQQTKAYSFVGFLERSEQPA